MIKIRKQNLRQGIRSIVTLFQYNEWKKIETIFKHTHTYTLFQSKAINYMQQSPKEMMKTLQYI